MKALPLCRQLRFVPICWRQSMHGTYEGRFSKYVMSCILADLQAVAGGQVLCSYYFKVSSVNDNELLPLTKLVVHWRTGRLQLPSDVHGETR